MCTVHMIGLRYGLGANLVGTYSFSCDASSFLSLDVPLSSSNNKFSLSPSKKSVINSQFILFSENHFPS